MMSGLPPPQQRQAAKAGSSDHHRAQYDAVCKERDNLQRSLEAMERENDELKKTVYELSYALSVQPRTGGSSNNPAIFSPDSLNAGARGLGTAGAGYGANGIGMNGAGGTFPANLRGPGDERLSNLTLDAPRRGGVQDRLLVSEGILSGHTAAVYAAAFSPCGNLVASCGFDRTVRLWEASYPYSAVACLAEHRQLVSDICWAPDGHSLVSCSFDQTVLLWDSETGQKVRNALRLEGLVQCVRYADGGDSMADAASSGGAVAYASSTSKHVYVIDLRDPMAVVQSMVTRGLVNTIHVYSDGTKLITGDVHGAITTWDTRSLREVERTELEYAIPISNLAASPPDAGRHEEEGQLLAVNCYDNTLRVYYRDRRGNGSDTQTPPQGGGKSAEAGGGQGAAWNATHGNRRTPSWRTHQRSGGSGTSSPPVTSISPSRQQSPTGVGASSLQLMHALRGHTVSHWPIRSAFFKGLQHRSPRLRRAGGNGAGGGALGGGRGAGGMGALEGVSSIGYEDVGKDWAHSLVLASGSIDSNIYMWDLSKSQGTEMPTLRGHTDRVYSVHFHPTEPRMVSCSGDSTVRIWGPSRASKRSVRGK